MMGIFAELERARTSPGGRPRCTRKERAIRNGLSIRQIAARAGVSVGTAYKMLKQHA
jgi:transposase